MYIDHEEEMRQMQNTMNYFIAYNVLLWRLKHTGISDDFMYGPHKLGGFNMINIQDFSMV